MVQRSVTTSSKREAYDVPEKSAQPILTLIGCQQLPKEKVEYRALRVYITSEAGKTVGRHQLGAESLSVDCAIGSQLFGDKAAVSVQPGQEGLQSL